MGFRHKCGMVLLRVIATLLRMCFITCSKYCSWKVPEQSFRRSRYVTAKKMCYVRHEDALNDSFPPNSRTIQKNEYEQLFSL